MNNTQRFQLAMNAIDRGALVVTVLIRAGVWITIAYFLMKSIESLAGEQTAASFVVELLGSLQADRYVAYIVGILGIGYGLNERRLRRNSVERLTRHSSELETRLDPSRTSSRLTPRGTTPKGGKQS